MQDNYELALAFDQDTPSFARGVEVGILWQRLQTEPRPVTAVVHASNAEMMIRMAEAHGVTTSADDIGGDWLTVTFG